MDLKKFILDWIAENPGIKGTQLAVDVVSAFHERRFLVETDVSEWIEVLNQLVADGELIEIEYVDPRMDYRVKSIYFLKKTKLRVINGNSDFEFSVGKINA